MSITCSDPLILKTCEEDPYLPKLSKACLVMHEDHNESFQCTSGQGRDVIPHQVLHGS